jgi:site-specific DNA-cytosine methylase
LNINGAGLSQLNTGKSAAVKGVGCMQNEWMYRVFTDGIEKYDADVVIIENAPALYTPKGEPVAQRIFDTVSPYGYSLTLYKTNTKFHGVPQSRDRTFALAWKSPVAPIMNYYDRESKLFLDYLNEVPEDALQQDIVINPKVENEPYYEFIKDRYKGSNPRDIIAQRTITAHNYVMKNDLLEEFVAWAHKTNNEKGIKYGEHALKKFSEGKGVWDGSVHVFRETMNAVIGRNMVDTIHPIHDRSLTIREALHMMAFPHNFELVGGRSKLGHIAQNVPACTGRDIVLEAIKYLNGELQYTSSDYVKQSNYKKAIEFESMERSTLEEFMS